MENREIKRGDIYYINYREDTQDCEQRGGRPGVIVSSDYGNAKSGNVSIVYLTTQDKRPMRTHVSVMAEKPSTAICEQVVTISKNRLGEYIKACDCFEIEEINAAIKYALGLADSMEDTRLLMALKVIKAALHD